MGQESDPPGPPPDEAYRFRLARATRGLPSTPVAEQTVLEAARADGDIEAAPARSPRERLIRDAGAVLIGITLLAVALWPAPPQGAVLGVKATPGPSIAPGFERSDATNAPPAPTPELSNSP